MTIHTEEPGRGRAPRSLRVLRRVSVAVVAGLAAAAALAHHSFAQFDRDTQNVITGKVARWAFNNPHAWLYVNVTNDDQTTTLWSFEGSGPINLLRRKINGNTFKPGDELLIMHCPMRDGRPGGHMGWVRLADGSFIDPSDGGCDGDEETIAKWQDWLTQGITSSRQLETD